jgi:hypothetical protein
MKFAMFFRPASIGSRQAAIAHGEGRDGAGGTAAVADSLVRVTSPSRSSV